MIKNGNNFYYSKEQSDEMLHWLNHDEHRRDHTCHVIKTLENTEGQSKMDNPGKLATQGAQDEDKHNTLCVGHHYT